MVLAATIVVKAPSDLAPVLLGAFGIGLALLSLGWQAWTFVRSGSRVEVTIAEGRRGLLGGQLGVATFPPQATPEQIAYMEEQGVSEPIIVVTAHNTGRGETSIVKCDVEFSDGGAYGNTSNDPALPFRLAGESEQSWYFPLDPIRGYVTVRRQQGAGPAFTVRGRVQLGSRKTHRSKNALAM